MCIRDSDGTEVLVVIDLPHDALVAGDLEDQRLLADVAMACLLYTSDAADAILCVDLGGRRLLKKKNQTQLTKITPLVRLPLTKNTCPSVLS